MNAETIEAPKSKRLMPAVIHGLSRAEYDLIDKLNWSKLKVLARSPAHYLHALTEPKEEKTDALIEGNATHVSVFEPEDFSRRFAVWREGKRSGKEWQAFKKSNAGRDILTEKQALKVHALSRAVRSDATAARHVSGGRAEVSITWTHALPEFAGMPEMRIESKARLDFVADCGVLVDLKTAQDGSPEAFARQVVNLSYLGQASWYRDGYEAATGRRLPFVFVVVEKTAPHVVTTIRVPERLMELGRNHPKYGYRTLLQRWAFCRSTSKWPGYSPDGGELELTLPHWADPDSGEDAAGLDLDLGAADAS